LIRAVGACPMDERSDEPVPDLSVRFWQSL
jgi:hypothetical protein